MPSHLCNMQIFFILSLILAGSEAVVTVFSGFPSPDGGSWAFKQGTGAFSFQNVSKVNITEMYYGNPCTDPYLSNSDTILHCTLNSGIWAAVSLVFKITDGTTTISPFPSYNVPASAYATVSNIYPLTVPSYGGTVNVSGTGLWDYGHDIPPQIYARVDPPADPRSNLDASEMCRTDDPSRYSKGNWILCDLPAKGTNLQYNLTILITDDKFNGRTINTTYKIQYDSSLTSALPATTPTPTTIVEPQPTTTEAATTTTSTPTTTLTPTTTKPPTTTVAPTTVTPTTTTTTVNPTTETPITTSAPTTEAATTTTSIPTTEAATTSAPSLTFCETRGLSAASVPPYGGNAFINGTGFESNVSDLKVTVDGFECKITATTESSLTCELLKLPLSSKPSVEVVWNGFCSHFVNATVLSLGNSNLTQLDAKLILDTISNSTLGGDAAKSVSTLFQLLIQVVTSVLRSDSLNSFSVEGGQIYLSATKLDLNSQVDTKLVHSDGDGSVQFPSSTISNAAKEAGVDNALAILIVLKNDLFQNINNDTQLYGQVNSVILVDSDGSEVPVKNAKENILISFPQLPSDFTQTPDCLYWDTATLNWKGDGCEFKLVSNLPSCSCNHLTNFSLGISNRITTNAVVDPNAPTSDSVNVGLIVGVAIGGTVIVVLVILVIVMRVQKRKKTETKEHNTHLELQTTERILLEKEDIQTGGVISSGLYGSVYKGNYRGTPVAMKEYQVPMIMLKEAAIMKILHHPNIAQYFGCYKDGLSRHFVVMEYMSGGSLLEYLHVDTEKDKDRDRFYSIAQQVCAALRYMEELGMVHGDVAARNVVLHIGTNGVIAKLADFSFARTLEDGKNLAGDDSPFSVRWAAPEVLNRKRLDTKSDVWSFGVLLWEMVNKGKVPYGQLSDSQVKKQVRKGLRLELSPTFEIQDIVKNCWETPDKRPTFTQLADEINAHSPFFQVSIDYIPSYSKFSSVQTSDPDLYVQPDGDDDLKGANFA